MKAQLAALVLITSAHAAFAADSYNLAGTTGVGIGICMGEAIIGNVGSPHYASFTIIGNPVNTAARRPFS
jgi:class 3 adenylate cyclase